MLKVKKKNISSKNEGFTPCNLINEQYVKNKMQFFNWFSTPFVQCQWENSESLNSNLKKLILEREKIDSGVARSNDGGWQSAGDFYRWTGESGKIVKERFLSLIKIATKKLNLPETKSMDFHLYSWACVNRKGHYNIDHIHPISTWSGVYYVDAGDEINKDKCGCFEAYHPNVSHVTSFFPGLSSGIEALQPKTSLMVLFPGYLRHGVRTYYGNRPRICIPMNSMVKFKKKKKPLSPLSQFLSKNYGS